MRALKAIQLKSERDTFLCSIGNTPLIPLLRLPAAHGVANNVQISAKAEWFIFSGGGDKYLSGRFWAEA